MFFKLYTCEILKQAILITAYKDFLQLARLTSEFDGRFNIYIHVDKKSRITSNERQILAKNKQIKYFSQDYKVNWGGFNHMRAYLGLISIALKNEDNIWGAGRGTAGALGGGWGCHCCSAEGTEVGRPEKHLLLHYNPSCSTVYQ